MKHKDLMESISYEEFSNHKGLKTKQVLEQELFAIMNGYDPKGLTKKELRQRDHDIGLTLLLLESTVNASEFQRIVNKIKHQLEPESDRRGWRDIFSGYRRRNK